MRENEWKNKSEREREPISIRSSRQRARGYRTGRDELSCVESNRIASRSGTSATALYQCAKARKTGGAAGTGGSVGRACVCVRASKRTNEQACVGKRGSSKRTVSGQGPVRSRLGAGSSYS